MITSKRALDSIFLSIKSMMLLLLLPLLQRELPILVLYYTDVEREGMREKRKMDNRC
jgi:hypothetical protein